MTQVSTFIVFPKVTAIFEFHFTYFVITYKYVCIFFKVEHLSRIETIALQGLLRQEPKLLGMGHLRAAVRKI
jgi:hypothetical protein